MVKSCMLMMQQSQLHIGAGTKRSPFCRRHFHYNFLEWKIMYLEYNFSEMFSKGLISCKFDMQEAFRENFHTLMGQWKSDETPELTHWSYISFCTNPSSCTFNQYSLSLLSSGAPWLFSPEIFEARLNKTDDNFRKVTKNNDLLF